MRVRTQRRRFATDGEVVSTVTGGECTLRAEHAARELAPRTPWVVGGKAYGGRVASLAVATEEIDAAGMLFYSYPLHPQGRPDKLRVDHWPDISVPCLFLRGDQDARCERSLLERNLRRLPRRARVHVVEGGDEALAVTSDHAPDGTSRPATSVTGEFGPLIESWLQDAIDQGRPTPPVRATAWSQTCSSRLSLSSTEWHRTQPLFEPMVGTISIAPLQK